jgi:hypothetical protein
MNVIEFLKPYKNSLSNLREKLKKEVQQLIDEKKINYEQAIRIFEHSDLFGIESYLINIGIFDVYTDYISGYWASRYETIYFSDISDWINDDDSDSFLKEVYDKSVNKEDLQKEIYDTIISDNIVGFKYDW